MKTILLTFLSLTSAGILSAATLPWNQFRGSTPGSAEEQQIETDALYEVCDKCGLRHQRLIPEEEVLDLLHSIKPDSVISDYYRKFPPLTLEPLIYSGYRPILIPDFTPAPVVFTMDARQYAYDRDRYEGILYEERAENIELEEGDEVLKLTTDSLFETQPEAIAEEINTERFAVIPEWLITGLRAQRIHQDILFRYMIANPMDIQYAYWELPEPPRLPEEDRSFKAYLSRLDLPEIDKKAAIIPEVEKRHINWLHTAGASLQFSQAYISSNWYQGGNNYLALLFSFNWDVALNTNFHPNKLFTSNLSYRLALNSNPKESMHRYSISQDQLQYNLKMGLKAFKKWFYSFNLQFKTQLFNSYPADSESLTASFLSPADLNMGIGMTYNLEARNKTLKFAASISPASYNLKTCFSVRIDHLQFNIAADRHTHSEIGSNAELTLSWDISSNISWKSRLFLFTDYSYFLGDWENTIVFNINKFLSTQIYLHPRFDSSADRNTSWRYWSLKEILSFGLSYTFSTKP